MPCDFHSIWALSRCLFLLYQNVHFDCTFFLLTLPKYFLVLRTPGHSGYKRDMCRARARKIFTVTSFFERKRERIGAQSIASI